MLRFGDEKVCKIADVAEYSSSIILINTNTLDSKQHRRRWMLMNLARFFRARTCLFSGILIGRRLSRKCLDGDKGANSKLGLVLRCRTRGDQTCCVGSADGSNLYEIRWEFGFWVWEVPKQFWDSRQPSNFRFLKCMSTCQLNSSLALSGCVTYVAGGSKRGRQKYHPSEPTHETLIQFFPDALSGPPTKFSH